MHVTIRTKSTRKLATVLTAAALSVALWGTRTDGIANAEDEVAPKRVGAICKLSGFEEGKESFKTKARGIGKIIVSLGESTKYYRVTSKPLSEVKEKEVLNVLGIIQEGQKDIEEPQVNGPLAFAVGDFPVPQISEKLLKRRGMGWCTGKVRHRERQMYVDKYLILTGSRAVAVFEEVKKGDLTSKERALIHVYGELGEKVKRETPIAAKSVAIVEGKIPSSDMEHLFLTGIERPKAPKADEKEEKKGENDGKGKGTGSKPKSD